MNAAALITAATSAGVAIRIDGDHLVLSAEHPPDESLLADLRAGKAETLAWLGSGTGWSEEDWRVLFDERAAIMEFDGGLSRDEAEARATNEVARIRSMAGQDHA